MRNKLIYLIALIILTSIVLAGCNLPNPSCFLDVQCWGSSSAPATAASESSAVEAKPTTTSTAQPPATESPTAATALTCGQPGSLAWPWRIYDNQAITALEGWVTKDGSDSGWEANLQYLTMDERTLTPFKVYRNNEDAVVWLYKCSADEFLVSFDPTVKAGFIQPTDVEVTLLRGEYNWEVVQITPTTATGFSFYGDPIGFPPGINWATASGGLLPGRTVWMALEVNDDVPVETYVGTAILFDQEGIGLIFEITVVVVD